VKALDIKEPELNKSAKQPVKETGIMFSTVMVQAYQQGLKTVTRRTWGLEKINEEPDKWEYEGVQKGFYVFAHIQNRILKERIAIKCPYGGKGDVLRVKETWMLETEDGTPTGGIIYKASDKPEPDGSRPLKWKPSIFMPKHASRYFLPLIADPIPERLQEITEADAKAEGIGIQGEITREEADKRGWNAGTLYGLAEWLKYDIFFYSAREAYQFLWDSINGKKYPYSMNPWEWPLRFPRYEL